jgi:hypothetical protein
MGVSESERQVLMYSRAARAVHAAMYARWDPLTRAMYEYVKARGVVTYSQLDGYIKTHHAAEIAGGWVGGWEGRRVGGCGEDGTCVGGWVGGRVSGCHVLYWCGGRAAVAECGGCTGRGRSVGAAWALPRRHGSAHEEHPSWNRRQ